MTLYQACVLLRPTLHLMPLLHSLIGVSMLRSRSHGSVLSAVSTEQTYGQSPVKDAP